MPNQKVNYSYKYPKISEYKVKLFSPLFMLAALLLAVMYLLSSKEITTDNMMQLILFPPILYLSATILNMTFKIDLLIKRILNVCEENLNLAQKCHIYKNKLLACEDEKNKHVLEKKISFALIVMIFSFFISKRLMIDTQYIKWALGAILIIIFFISLRDISRFFYNLAETCYPVIIKDDHFAESFSDKDIIKWKAFEYKWRKALALNIILLLLTIVIFFIFKDFKGTISFVSLFMATIIIFKIAMDVDTTVKSNLTIMGKYDEYIKNKLGLTFLQSKLTMKEEIDVLTRVPDVELKFSTFKKIFKK